MPPGESRRMVTRRSTKGFSASSSAQRGSTAQVRRLAGWLCFSEATAGRVWMISPMEPSRTTRMRVLAGLPALNMLLQFAGAHSVGVFQTHDLRGFERRDKSLQFPIIGGYHVVYHA